MEVVIQESFNWWTDVVVPLGVALLGASAALYVGWRGARWAAEEQRKHAERIDKERRRRELEAASLMRLDEAVEQLEQRAGSFEATWSASPGQMWSNWGAELLERALAVETVWMSVRSRVGHIIEPAMTEFESVDVREIAATQEIYDQRKDEESIADARAVNFGAYMAATTLRGRINELMP